MQILTFHLLFLLLICSQHAAGIAYMYFFFNIFLESYVVHRQPIGMSIRRKIEVGNWWKKLYWIPSGIDQMPRFIRIQNCH